jgi:hypothetical protein
LIKNELKPQVYFTSVKTNKDRTFYQLGELKFEHDENTISLNASSLSLTSPNRNKYKFTKIFNDNIQEHTLQESGNIVYYNLKPGKYKFLVDGTNNDGESSSNTDSIQITILEAFWQTWYFQVSLLLAILALSYGVYSFRVYRIKQENAKLDALVRVRTKELQEEKEVSERLLLNILPKNIASRLKNGESNIADSFGEVTVLFADLVGFTKLSQVVSPQELVAKLNDLFSRFDKISIELGVEKIKTIGDCYMAVAGLPKIQKDHSELAVKLALKMLDAIQDFNQENNMIFGEMQSIRQVEWNLTVYQVEFMLPNLHMNY